MDRSYRQHLRITRIIKMTLRDLIKQETAGLLSVEKLGPHIAAERLVALTSLLASLGAEIALKRANYAQVRVNYLNTSKSAVEAKIRSEATPEFNEWQEREEMRKALIQIVQAIKYYLRLQQDEMKL